MGMMMMMTAVSQRPIHDPFAVPWGPEPHHSSSGGKSGDDNCAFHAFSQIDGEWKLSC